MSYQKYNEILKSQSFCQLISLPAWVPGYTCMESMMMVKIYGHLLVRVVILKLHVHINAIITLK